MELKEREKYVVVKKAQLDDLINAFNATLDFVWIVKCAKCGTMHAGNYCCPKCGSDPDKIGSCQPDLNVIGFPYSAIK